LNEKHPTEVVNKIRIEPLPMLHEYSNVQTLQSIAMNFTPDYAVKELGAYGRSLYRLRKEADFADDKVCVSLMWNVYTFKL
jgi:hypothetical protein